MIDRLQQIYTNADIICQNRNWGKDWLHGGCYLHLEASELIESIRGKGTASPAEEAGDVLFALFSMLAYYKIPLNEVIELLEQKIKRMLEEDRTGSGK